MQTDPSLRLRGTREPSGGQRNPVMLRAAKHLDAHADRPFAAAQGDTVRQLRLMRIGADKSAMGTINRPLQLIPFNSQCSSLTVNVHHCAPTMFFLPVLLARGGRWRRLSKH